MRLQGLYIVGENPKCPPRCVSFTLSFPSPFIHPLPRVFSLIRPRICIRRILYVYLLYMYNTLEDIQRTNLSDSLAWTLAHSGIGYMCVYIATSRDIYPRVAFALYDPLNPCGRFNGGE